MICQTGKSTLAGAVGPEQGMHLAGINGKYQPGRNIPDGRRKTYVAKIKKSHGVSRGRSNQEKVVFTESGTTIFNF
jgi:hypothetical protein